MFIFAAVFMFETYDNEILGFVKGSKRTSMAGPRLGIIGGGQLAKMTAMSALRLGCDVLVLERNNYSPAANLATHSIVGDWDDPEALVKLASQVDVVMLENEFVNAAALTAIEEAGCQLYPSARTVGIVQDKFTQKTALKNSGVRIPRFAAVTNREEITAAGETFGWPVVLKTRRNGYDGKGNATIRSAEEVESGWQKLGAGTRELLVEEWCPFVKELAVIVTRAINGEFAVYPVVETVQQDHICHRVLAPAPVADEIARSAAALAVRAVTAVDGVGSFGVELFLTGNDELVLNELAPRVHNSGHYTIEACRCSQFENHVRAVLGWPLGSAELVMPAAAMENLIGASKGPGRPLGIEKALAVSGAHVHVYGKAMSGAGRKMGHITALGRTLDEAQEQAGRAAREIRFGN